MARRFALALLVLMGIGGAGAAPAPWTEYFGGHYEAAPWGTSIRDPGGPGRFGFRVPGGRAPPPQWSGSGNPDELRPLLSRGAVVLNVGGLGSGRDAEQVAAFLDGVRRDQGATWKRELLERARRIAALPGAAAHVYWQFGNEINGPRFVRNIAHWAGVEHLDMPAVMREFIPVYVEYFLAPGAEAIRNASHSAFGDPGRIHVMLGSLANASNPRSVQWYGELLNYTIKGTYAPSLAGRKVNEIVDTLSVHYLMMSADWSENLGQINRDWVGKGHVKAVWSTEEVGARRALSGYGGATALRVTARYLSWWSDKGWDASQGHCFFWGSDMGPAGTRVDDALSLLIKFAGPSVLRPIYKTHTGDLESYLFAVGSDDRRVLIIFNRDAFASSRLDTLSVPAVGWGGQPSATIHVYAPQGVRSQTGRMSRQADELKLVFPEALRLGGGETALILLERH